MRGNSRWSAAGLVRRGRREGIYQLEERVLASTLLRAGVTAAAIMLLGLTSSALAAQPAQRKAADAAPPWVNSGLQSGATAALAGRSGFSRQHGGADEHLPAVRENVELGRQAQGQHADGVPDAGRTQQAGSDSAGQIADLAIYKDAAYLNSWAEPVEADDTASAAGSSRSTSPTRRTRSSWRSCRRCRSTYHGEGAPRHVTRRFNGATSSPSTTSRAARTASAASTSTT